MRNDGNYKVGSCVYNTIVVLLDESGDLGFAPHSSRHFVVTTMAVHDPNELVRLIKNARKRLGKKDWKGELKFNKAMDPTKIQILNGLENLDCQIAWTSFEKKELPSALLKNEKLLYLTACEIVLREIFRRIPARRMDIMIDKRHTNQMERDRLDRHIRSLLVNSHAGNFVPQIMVSQYDSMMKKELQVHDFVTGAIFQYVERDVETYIELIKSKIVSGQKR